MGTRRTTPTQQPRKAAKDTGRERRPERRRPVDLTGKRKEACLPVCFELLYIFNHTASDCAAVP